MFNSRKLQMTILVGLSLIAILLSINVYVEVIEAREGSQITTIAAPDTAVATQNVGQVIEVSKEIFVQQNTNKVMDKEPFIVAIFGTDAENNNISRTDTIMLVRYDMENKTAQMVSIPRDTYVDIPGHHKDKINAAHSYGEVPLAIETIENFLDIHIDYYAKANFEGFKKGMKVVGPIEIDVKKKISYGGVTINKGLQKLEGEELLTYVRFRKDSDGDFGRINRQQEVIKKSAEKLMSPATIFKLPKLLNVLSENVETDLNLKEMASLALEAKNYNDIEISNVTLKTTSFKENGIWFEKANQEHVEELSDILNGD